MLRVGGEPQDYRKWRDQEAHGRADHNTESRRLSWVDHVVQGVTHKDRNTDLHCLAGGFCLPAKFFSMEPGDRGQVI